MRPIRLPEPPSGSIGTPEIFFGGVNVVRRAVVIGNGFPGAENQSFGLVRALGLSDRQIVYRVTRPKGGINNWLRWLPISFHKALYDVIRQIFGNSRFAPVFQGRKMVPFPAQNGNFGLASVLEADAKKIASLASETFDKEGPLLIVASGRDTISLASSVRRLAHEKIFVIQIQHPRSRLDMFDMVVTPRHDYYALTERGQQEIPCFLRRWITPKEPPGRNVVLTMGALHQADSAALRVAASAWHDELAPLPKPLLIVNVGGPTSKVVVSGNCKYRGDLAIQLVGSLQNVLATCGSVRVSFSRRTPKNVSDIIFRELGNHPKIYIWDGKGPNPHLGHLAWGDAFVITADSISMLSEACSTGKPVYVIGSEHCKWKFSAFHEDLRERGVVRPFTGLEDISNSWSYPPLNDMAEVAARVREALSERGWTLGH